MPLCAGVTRRDSRAEDVLLRWSPGGSLVGQRPTRDACLCVLPDRFGRSARVRVSGSSRFEIGSLLRLIRPRTAPMRESRPHSQSLVRGRTHRDSVSAPPVPGRGLSGRERRTPAVLPSTRPVPTLPLREAKSVFAVGRVVTDSGVVHPGPDRPGLCPAETTHSVPRSRVEGTRGLRRYRPHGVRTPIRDPSYGRRFSSPPPLCVSLSLSVSLYVSLTLFLSPSLSLSVLSVSSSLSLLSPPSSRGVHPRGLTR